MAVAALRQKRHADRNHGAQTRPEALLLRERGSLHQMRPRSRKLRGAGSIVFAPPAAENHPLKVAQFPAWRAELHQLVTVIHFRFGPRPRTARLRALAWATSRWCAKATRTTCLQPAAARGSRATSSTGDSRPGGGCSGWTSAGRAARGQI